MPSVSEQQNPAPLPVPVLRTPPSTFIKFVRIFLLVLIVIGLILIATESLWVPKLVNTILQNQTPTISSTTNNLSSTTSSTSAWISVEADNSSNHNGYIYPSDLVTYKIDSGNVFYNINDDTQTSPSFLPVSQADATTFLVLANQDWYAKDKNSVYLQGKIFTVCPDATCTQEITLDPSTFSIVPPNATGNLFQYVKDKNGVYYDNPDSGNWVLLKNADPSTFVSFWVSNETYGKDKNTVWFGNQVVQGADAPTFTAIDIFGQDAEHVYYMGQVIPGADPKTFTPLGLIYSEDAQHVFYGTTTVPNANPKTFSQP